MPSKLKPSLKPLHDPSQGPLRVVGLMSGSGSNLRKILELQKRLEENRGTSPFQVVAIFTDNPEGSKANQIGKDFGVPVEAIDVKKFYAERGKPLKDLGVRVEFDKLLVEKLKPYNAKVAAYAGYMRIATKPLLDAFLGVNVHPADLSVLRGGKRAFTGAHAVRDAILAGQRHLRSSTHIIEPEVDHGRILMVSSPLRVKRGKLDKGDKGAVRKFSDEHQERLKERGDWQVFPRTLLNIAQGNFKVDDSGRVYFNNRPAPEGVRLNRSPAVSWGVERVSRARAKARAALKRRRQRTGLRALK